MFKRWRLYPSSHASPYSYNTYLYADARRPNGDSLPDGHSTRGNRDTHATSDCDSAACRCYGDSDFATTANNVATCQFHNL